MLKLFTEFEDKYEKEFESDTFQVLVSVDKANVSDLTEILIKHISTNLEKVMADAVRYFDGNKESYEVGYIDDLSDPQIILGADGYSVYWCSEKGEEQGEAVIGIDYSWPQNMAQGIIIGD